MAIVAHEPGRPTGVVAIVRDMTRLKLANDECSKPMYDARVDVDDVSVWTSSSWAGPGHVGNPTLKGTQSCYSLCTGKGAAVAGAAEDAAMGAESAGRQGRLSAHRPHHGQAVRRAASGVNDPLPCRHADDRHHAHQRSVLGRMRCLRALLLRTSVAGVC